jgi:hypothetical protein
VSAKLLCYTYIPEGVKKIEIKPSRHLQGKTSYLISENFSRKYLKVMAVNLNVA